MTYVNTTYTPKTAIDRQLLASVLQKVFNWLSHVDPEIAEQGTYDKLSWHFNVDGQSSIFIDSNDYPTQVWLQGNLMNPTTVYGLESWMEDISGNLDLFVEFERMIYDVIEKIAEAARARQAAAYAEQIEEEAKVIYSYFDGADQHPWVEGGNSLMQDEARRQARESLARAREAGSEDE
jgi:hypothetical protein